MSILSKLKVVAPAGRSSHILLDTQETRFLATAWLSAKAETKAAESKLEVATADLQPSLLSGWVAANIGRAKPEGSVLVPADTGGSILASFAAVWSAKGGVDLLPDDLKRERFTIKIDGDALPAEKAGAFVDGLLKLAADLGVTEAVKATGGMAPVPTFNESRFVRLTAEQNVAVEMAGLGTRLSLRAK